MAEHRDVEYATAAGNDYAEHEGTYRLFLSILKWSAGLIVLVLILMAVYVA